MALDLAVTERPGQRNCAVTPFEGLGDAAREHRELGGVAEGHRQLMAWRERLQRGYRQVAVPLGVLAATEEPGQPRQPTLRGADGLGRRIGLFVQFERMAAGEKRLLDVIGQVALVGQMVDQLSGPGAVEHFGKPQREPVLPHRFPVRAQPGGVGGGRDRVADRVLLTAAARRMVRESVIVGAPQPNEGREGGGVQPHTDGVGQVGLDRLPGDLVTEREPAVLDPDEHPVADTFVDGLDRLAGDLAEQRKGRPGAEDRCGTEDVAGGGGEATEPGAHRVAHRRRHVGRAGCQHFGDEERVATGAPVQRARVE